MRRSDHKMFILLPVSRRTVPPVAFHGNEVYCSVQSRSRIASSNDGNDAHHMHAFTLHIALKRLARYALSTTLPRRLCPLHPYSNVLPEPPTTRTGSGLHMSMLARNDDVDTHSQRQVTRLRRDAGRRRSSGLQANCKHAGSTMMK